MTFRQFMELISKLDEMTKLMSEIVKLLDKPKTDWGDITPKWDGSYSSVHEDCFLCENGMPHITHRFAEEE